MKKIVAVILLMCSTSFGEEIQIGEAIIDVSKVTYVDEYTIALKEYNTEQYRLCKEDRKFCDEHRTSGLYYTYGTADLEKVEFYLDDCEYDYGLCLYKTMIETWE